MRLRTDADTTFALPLSFRLSFVRIQNYGVTFPMMAKSDVNGSNTNEVFQFLKKQKTGILGTEMISELLPNSNA